MSIRTLLVPVGLLIACGIALSQPLPKPAPPPPVEVPQRLDYFPPPAPPPSPPLPPPVRPAPKSVEELLTELESVQAQKAELERKEKELKAAVSKKLAEQAERLKKLGIAPPPAKEPDRVGRIIIEGNTKTPNRKILEKLELQPGQILQYPKLEAARARLRKAGFRGVVVEVVPNELDDAFKDIRVRVTESKPKPAPAPAPIIRG